MTSVTCGGGWCELNVTANGVVELGRRMGFPPTWAPPQLLSLSVPPCLAQGPSLIGFLPATCACHCGSCYSVTKLYPTLCDPMDCSTPGFLVLHYLQEFAQIHVHGVDDAV